MGTASRHNQHDPGQTAKIIVQEFQQPQRASRRLLSVTSVVCAVLAACAVARLGTDLFRALAAVGIVCAVFGALGLGFWTRRRARDLNLSLAQTLSRFDPDRAGRVARAYRLYQTARSQNPSVQVSVELAELHASRSLELISLHEVRTMALGSRKLRMRVVLGLAGLVTLLMVVWSLAFFEGFDVLLAKDGVGPLPIAYVEELEITAEWPSYLDGTGQQRRLHSEFTGVPQGSEIEVRVLPRVWDRRLFLTDGNKLVPLLSDGQGRLVARWVADNPAGLKVAAQFGDVLLYDVHQTRLEPLNDRAPLVVLSGAPRTVALSELERLELEFTANDDHGLSQVDLVLTSGQRSVRTELVRLDAQTLSYRGGHALTREHELLRRPFLPVHVRVEARDGNTATGPQWGKSQEIILLPEPLGTSTAERHIALRTFRKAVSRYVATLHEAGYKDRTQQIEIERSATESLYQALTAVRLQFETDPGAPARSLAFLSAQVEALGRTGKERAQASSVLLAVDALISALGQKEAVQLAKDLGQSVEEIAVQARQLRFDPGSLSLEGLMDLLVGNQSGAQQLSEVGVLGLDLGLVAKADLARIERSIKERAFDRAEAAALHLAERLKRATPSFSSSGGGGAGVESGSPSKGASGAGSGSPGQGTSEAPSEFEKVAEGVNDLAREGAQELSELDRLLAEAEEALRQDFEQAPELDAALNELKDALTQLPEVGRGTGSASSEAASARSQGDAMVEALERGELNEAKERGRDAEQALARARSLLEQGFGYLDDASLDRAHKAVVGAIQSVDRVLQKQQAQSAPLNAQQQKERAERQRSLAERARQLKEQGSQPQSALPRDQLDHLGRAAQLLEQAAQSLDGGQGDHSRALAEEAQRHLEQATFEVREQESNTSGDENGDGHDLALQGQVPNQERDRAKDFRERIERGLGRGSGRLAPAVRRYAEDLK